MKGLLRVLLFIGFVSNVSFGQQSVAKHTVLKGETIPQIAQNYNTTPSEIYRLNPEAQNGIAENQMLNVPELLPQSKNTITHTVAPKETLFGLATKYNIKVEAIQSANTVALANGLQVGQQLVIPQENTQKTETVIAKNTHLVQPKESLFSIARLYNVSVEDLDKANSAILKDGLQVGQEIKIPNKKKTLDGRVRVINAETVFYVVKAKETKYSIAKQFGITVEQLESQNPEIVNGLTEGNKLAINVKEVKPTNENEELMLALAEKQVVVEKSKANAKEINSLKEKLVLQEEINQKVINVNGLLVNLKEIENTKEGSAEKLKLVLEANKNIQEILLVKLDSLVKTMGKDLNELKKTELVDLDESIRLQKISNENIQKTNELSQQLKKQLAENRKVYSGLMDKAERIVVEENQEYKKSIRENSKTKVDQKTVKFTPVDLKNMEMEQKTRDLNNMKLITKLDSLNNESKSELKLHISKAAFYSKQARLFDDNLAKLKNQSYQNKAYESQTKAKTAVVSKSLTLDQIKKELAKQPAKVKAIKIEKIEGVKDLKSGYYVVLGNFHVASERDAFIRKLTDSGSLDANFFYNINILSYYVYSKTFATKEEAQYEFVQKQGKPLFEKMFIANIISENTIKE
ncbi:LysM peptidoglycan-binding domain-containing protein [Flavobacterium sp. M31R6]|uniref:LysM peptidoglycan-binding domain-containing protein n=1 Tax=Flavobacterium sp. M31R6 TaxID=2739062 RepID=UPI001569CC91|nr:LysM peptidoglycan-binding domain-containing protein [Flavobacterium sp. M31R6]QKJ62982.1 LysM peptidoglycan-binding domain-containing protein [Flavobacterium sp. M31R6]